MQIIQTLPNGTTIEFGEDAHGNQVHRVCTANGSMCRYVEPHHCAATYAQQFDEYYLIQPGEQIPGSGSNR
jgi:hypothetical protein